jgi:hypothetical protein
LFDGDENLEIVGEASYQDALWLICARRLGDQVRHDVIAALVPEPDNAYDPNAISVQVDGYRVGYMSRSDAIRYGPGLRSLMAKHQSIVALNGVIVGGGYFKDGPGRLGVWLRHDPTDFGIELGQNRTGAGSGPLDSKSLSPMRTGFSDARATDLADDSYDLSWFDRLPAADGPAIVRLRKLLSEERDPISRHFQFAELERRLYRCRDLYPDALAEFDEACTEHDAEMSLIAAAFIGKWGKIPMLEVYRQMAIRQQKLKHWDACRWWAERGLSVYGEHCARQDAVEDLQNRRSRALAKLETAQQTVASASPEPSLGTPSDAKATSANGGAIEQLTCGVCGSAFERVRVRGRKPLLCPNCRALDSR